MNIRKFPATIVLLVQYVPLVLLPSFLNHTPRKDFIFGLVLSGLFVTAFVESLLAPLRGRQVRKKPNWLDAKAIYFVLAIGLASTALAAAQGAGSYESQVGSRPKGALSVVFTPLEAWAVVGLALVFYGMKIGLIKKRGILVVAASFFLLLAHGVFIARLAPVISLGLALGFALLATRTFPIKWMLIAAMGIFLLWPALYQFRNQTRIQYGASQIELAQHQASDRLRLDENLSRASTISPPIDVGQPGPLTILRYGLIPRALDSGRAEVSTAEQLNITLGGSANSAFSFTVLGNVYVLNGWAGLFVFLTIISIAIGFLVRSPGPFAFVAAVFMVLDLLWVESTFPDSVAGYIQHLVSAGAAFLVIRLWAGFKSSRRARHRAPIPAWTPEPRGRLAPTYSGSELSP